MNKDVVKVNWSGGKDSSCSAHLHLMQGDECIICNYIPMFTAEIPLILKDHYEFIIKIAERFREMGAKVYMVSGETYWDYVLHVAKKGKNKGKIFGFPCFKIGQCGFKRDSKEKALGELDSLFSLIYDYQDIGIAFDEIDRYNQLSEKKRSILVERNITEEDAMLYCKKNGLYSPHYSRYRRDGCVLCPNASAMERIEWFKQYPNSFDLLLQLQEIVAKERPDIYPLRNYRRFIEEDYQLDLFGFFNEKRFLIN